MHDRRPAAGKLASLHRASGSLHGEAWAGRFGSLSLTISQEVEIATGCPTYLFLTLLPRHLDLEGKLRVG